MELQPVKPFQMAQHICLVKILMNKKKTQKSLRRHRYISILLFIMPARSSFHTIRKYPLIKQRLIHIKVYFWLQRKKVFFPKTYRNHQKRYTLVIFLVVKKFTRTQKNWEDISLLLILDLVLPIRPRWKSEEEEQRRENYYNEQKIYSSNKIQTLMDMISKNTKQRLTK